MRDKTARFQSINDTAYLTGLSRASIRKGCKAGTTPHIRAGCKYLVNVPKFVELLDRASVDSMNRGETE